MVAPDTEQSATSHALTVRSPIEVKRVDDHHYRVGGTPTDCIVMAIQVILRSLPDLVVSGVNHGPNMGEDVHYSGTVAAAVEGVILGVPAVAFSALQSTVSDPAHVEIVREIVRQVLAQGLAPDDLLNVNIPDPTISKPKGVRITKTGSRHYENFIDPAPPRSEHSWYTIGGEAPVWKDDEGTDIEAIRAGYVSVTPLHLDLTDYRAIVEMERWRFEL